LKEEFYTRLFKKILHFYYVARRPFGQWMLLFSFSEICRYTLSGSVAMQLFFKADDALVVSVMLPRSLRIFDAAL